MRLQAPPLDPALLPEIETLRRRAKALAMIEAIVRPEWEMRYCRYHLSWCPDQDMVSLRRGSGEGYFLLFGPFCAGINGLLLEGSMASGGDFLAHIRSILPATFTPFLDHAEFGWDKVPFCYWRSMHDNGWSRIKQPVAWKRTANDGSAEMLSLLHEPANCYVEFARQVS